MEKQEEKNMRISPLKLGYIIFYSVSFAVLFVLSLVFMHDFKGFLLIFYLISFGVLALELLWIIKPALAERIFGVLAYFGSLQYEKEAGVSTGKVRPVFLLSHLLFLIFSHGTITLALIYGLLT